MLQASRILREELEQVWLVGMAEKGPRAYEGGVINWRLNARWPCRGQIAWYSPTATSPVLIPPRSPNSISNHKQLKLSKDSKSTLKSNAQNWKIASIWFMAMKTLNTKVKRWLIWRPNDLKREPNSNRECQTLKGMIFYWFSIWALKNSQRISNINATSKFPIVWLLCTKNELDYD